MIIAQWTLDNPDLMGEDSSGFGYHLTPQGIEPTRPLRSGQGYGGYFSPDNTPSMGVDSIVSPDKRSFAIEFWYMGAAEGVVASSPGAYGVWFESGTLHASIQDTEGVVHSGPVAVGVRWLSARHVLVSFDRGLGEVRAHVDGVVDTSFLTPGLGVVNSAEGLTIGSDDGSYLSGILDDVTIHFGIPTDVEVTRRFEEGRVYQEYDSFVEDSLPILHVNFFTDADVSDSLTTLEDFALQGYEDNLVYDAESISLAPALLWYNRNSAALIGSPVTLESSNPQSVEFVATAALDGGARVLSVLFSDGSSLTIDMAGDDITLTDTVYGATTLPLVNSGFPPEADDEEGGSPDSDIDAIIDGGAYDDFGGYIDGGDAASSAVGGWGHIVVRLRNNGVDLILNGVLHLLTGSSSRTIQSVSLAPDFGGIVQNFTLYDYQLSYADAEMHHDIAYHGRFILDVIEDTNPAIVEEVGYETYNYEWTVVPA